jgi:hypothetical protein
VFDDHDAPTHAPTHARTHARTHTASEDASSPCEAAHGELRDGLGDGEAVEVDEKRAAALLELRLADLCGQPLPLAAHALVLDLRVAPAAVGQLCVWSHSALAASLLAAACCSAHRATAAHVSGEGTTLDFQLIGVDGVGRWMGTDTLIGAAAAAATRVVATTGNGSSRGAAGNAAGAGGARPRCQGIESRGGSAHRAGVGTSRRASRASRSMTSFRVSRSPE